MSSPAIAKETCFGIDVTSGHSVPKRSSACAGPLDLAQQQGETFLASGASTPSAAAATSSDQTSAEPSFDESGLWQLRRIHTHAGHEDSNARYQERFAAYMAAEGSNVRYQERVAAYMAAAAAVAQDAGRPGYTREPAPSLTPLAHLGSSLQLALCPSNCLEGAGRGCCPQAGKGAGRAVSAPDASGPVPAAQADSSDSWYDPEFLAWLSPLFAPERTVIPIEQQDFGVTEGVLTPPHPNHEQAPPK